MLQRVRHIVVDLDAAGGEEFRFAPASRADADGGDTSFASRLGVVASVAEGKSILRGGLLPATPNLKTV
jgi:hypothetical protein